MAWLDQVLGDVSGRIVSAYWPFRGEPDLRPWIKSLEERGAVCSLPVVVQRHAPLVFRSWRRDEPLEPGVWKIPVPSSGITVTPDIVVAPSTSAQTLTVTAWATAVVPAHHACTLPGNAVVGDRQQRKFEQSIRRTTMSRWRWS